MNVQGNYPNNYNGYQQQYGNTGWYPPHGNYNPEYGSQSSSYTSSSHDSYNHHGYPPMQQSFYPQQQYPQYGQPQIPFNQYGYSQPPSYHQLYPQYGQPQVPFNPQQYPQSSPPAYFPSQQSPPPYSAFGQPPMPLCPPHMQCVAQPIPPPMPPPMPQGSPQLQPGMVQDLRNLADISRLWSYKADPSKINIKSLITDCDGVYAEFHTVHTPDPFAASYGNSNFGKADPYTLVTIIESNLQQQTVTFKRKYVDSRVQYGRSDLARDLSEAGKELRKLGQLHVEYANNPFLVEKITQICDVMIANLVVMASYKTTAYWKKALIALGVVFLANLIPGVGHFLAIPAIIYGLYANFRSIPELARKQSYPGK